MINKLLDSLYAKNETVETIETNVLVEKPTTLTSSKIHPINEQQIIYNIHKNIRNFRILNKKEFEYINTMDKDQLLEILIIYNECTKLINLLFE